MSFINLFKRKNKKKSWSGRISMIACKETLEYLSGGLNKFTEGHLYLMEAKGGKVYVQDNMMQWHDLDVQLLAHFDTSRVFPDMSSVADAVMDVRAAECPRDEDGSKPCLLKHGRHGLLGEECYSCHTKLTSIYALSVTKKQ